MFVPLVLSVSVSLRIENNNAYILKRYLEFEELHDTLKRNLPVSRIVFLFLV